MVSSSYSDHSSGGKGKRERQGVNVPKLYIRLRSRLKEEKVFRM